MTAADVDELFEPLYPSEILAQADLGTFHGRGTQGYEFVADTTVHCGRPVVYPVAAADLPPFLRSRAAATGYRYHGALFAFDLDPPRAGGRYTRARFEVALADPPGPLALREAVPFTAPLAPEPDGTQPAQVRLCVAADAECLA
jgi:hypothetical protein